jgi:hypothetical protein
MLTTDQKSKKIANAQKRIDALQARVDRIAKLQDVSAELAYEKAQLAVLREAPVSDSTSTVVDVQTTHNAEPVQEALPEAVEPEPVAAPTFA